MVSVAHRDLATILVDLQAACERHQQSDTALIDIASIRGGDTLHD